ncbi:phosphotransferase family protein [Endozoicomonadaceae bacterium StTr2]
MAEVIDQPRPVRAGEELDTATLDAYLKQHIPGLTGTLELTQFPGGASNLTYQLKYDDRELVLRRPPFGTKAKSAHDMGRECRVMSALHGHYPVPEVLVFCQDDSIMGCDFYVMEKVTGIIPRKEMPKGLELTEEQTRQMCSNVLQKLLELHSLDYKALGLEQLGKGEGYVKRQVEGWSHRYRKARTPDVPDFEEVMTWLDKHQPADVKTCLIHNDFRLDNVILNPDDPEQVIGVLDWEMCTLGDPLMDLGSALAYWIQADDDPVSQALRIQPSHLPGMMTRDEIVEWYCQHAGLKIQSFDFYLVYGLFRLAGIVQQIYYRYYHGQTQDKRFAVFNQMVIQLEQRCQTIVQAALQKQPSQHSEP